MQEDKSILEFVNIENPKQLNPLVLAYIGDAVYELLSRSTVLSITKNPKRLHRENSKIVSARGQKESVLKILPFLTEEEENILKRGRNAKSGTVPKNANLSDYKEATGLESLFGYLYLMKREQRLIELFKITRSEK